MITSIIYPVNYPIVACGCAVITGPFDLHPEITFISNAGDEGLRIICYIITTKTKGYENKEMAPEPSKYYFLNDIDVSKSIMYAALMNPLMNS